MNPTEPAATPWGLRTVRGTAVPLLGVAVTGEVIGAHARTVVRQRYRNAESVPVEAIYTFPLPSDATVTGFVMECAGRRMEAEVKERDEAFYAYDDAVNAGHGAALLDQERANVFTATVGNLLPGEETLVEVEYVQRVQADEGSLRWTIPTLVAPRYIPGGARGERTAHGTHEPTAAVPDADRISPPIAAVSYGLALDVFFAARPDAVVESPSHRVTATPEEGGVRVRFAEREVALDRDVVLTVRSAAAGPLTTVAAHREGEDGYVAVTVVPDLFDHARREARTDVVFLVDVSGSMQGASLEQARSALRLCLRQLREGDRFNIVAFESSFRVFAPASVPFTQATLDRADDWVSGLVARGGTEMLAPLVHAVRGAPDVVVLLTDGQVGNEEQILEAIPTSSTRFYTFGIGTNVSDVLLRDLARRSGGGYEGIYPGERIDDKVVAQFARATAARVTGLAARWVDVDAGELAPADLPALIDGEPWVVFGRYERPGRGRLELRGECDGQPFYLAVPVDLPASARAPAVPKLWARERIRDLSQRAEGATGRRAGANRARIVKLAVEHRVASAYTSFVVIEKRTGDRRSSGMPETRVVPVSAPAGWGMVAPASEHGAAGGGPVLGIPSGAPTGPLAAFPAVRAREAFMGRAAPRAAAPARLSSRATSESFAARGGPVPQPAPVHDERAEHAGAPSTAARPLDRTLARQLASGLWADAASPAATDDTALVRGTAFALLELVQEGVTTAHALYGAQVRKAIDALVPLAVRVAATAPRLAELALAAALLAASGARTRKVVADAAAGAGLPLVDEAAVRARLKDMIAAV